MHRPTSQFTKNLGTSPRCIDRSGLRPLSAHGLGIGERGYQYIYAGVYSKVIESRLLHNPWRKQEAGSGGTRFLGHRTCCSVIHGYPWVPPVDLEEPKAASGYGPIREQCHCLCIWVPRLARTHDNMVCTNLFNHGSSLGWSTRVCTLL